MSILIKGMEMPENCGECLLAKLSPTGESIYCNYSLSTVPWDERPFDCPLVPVPEHGRLIDADALEALFWDGQCYFTENIKYKIKNIETIIPADEG